VRESRDEDSLYHLSQDPEKPGRFLKKGDKLVDGKPVTMGTVGCGYDLKSHTLECAMPSGGVIRLLVQGSEMHGTMTLANKTGGARSRSKTLDRKTLVETHCTRLPWGTNPSSTSCPSIDRL
jgi:hypothetical protein